MKLYKKNQYKYVKKLANSGLRLVAWGTQADVIEDNGTVLYEEARDIYLKSFVKKHILCVCVLVCVC